MARQRFAAEVERPDAEIDLARAALLVAQEEYPQLAVEPYLARLDAMAEEVRDRLDQETAPLVVLNELNHVLFERHSFRGNTEAYYDPRNSFLNDVLDRRLGIPITLSVVYLEVGWRLGLPLMGVGFPGRFLVRFEGVALRVLIDPFEGGRLRFQDQAQELLDRIYGGLVRVHPSFLRPVSKRDMLIRILANLKSIYLNVRDDAHALAQVERILLLRPSALGEARDRGLILARMGRVAEAVQQLEEYLDFAPRAPDALRIRDVLKGLKASPPRPRPPR